MRGLSAPSVRHTDLHAHITASEFYILVVTKVITTKQQQKKGASAKTCMYITYYCVVIVNEQ